MGYSAGNLELNIQTVSANANTSLEQVNAKLMTMMNLIGHITTNFKSLNVTLKSMSRMSFNWTTKLVQGLTNISKFETRDFYTKINSLTRIMQPFTAQVVQSSQSLSTMRSEMKSIAGIKNISLPDVSTKKKTTKSKISGSDMDTIRTFSFSDALNKLYFIRNYTKQTARSLAQMVQNGIDYTETLNLWQVAMKNNRQEATAFVNDMAKAYGFATQTIMKYQATFRNMLSSLGGISDDISYQLSEFLTQMASDYASLYNVSIDRAMTTFQSVLSGQVRPIRSISGYDITETTIYQLYQQLGGTKTMRQLSQTEKRLLRIYAVFQQMESSGAIGDLSKTLNNSANQLRIANEQLKELSTWLGNIVNTWLEPMLPTLNAILITATEITKALAKAMGYKDFEGAIGALEEVNEQIDEATGKLLSFDRFESLSGGGTESALGIDEKLLSGLSQYTSVLDDVKSKAQEIAKVWTDWWIAEDGGLTDQAETLLTILESLSIVIGGLVLLNLGKKLSNLIAGITGVKNASQTLNVVLATGILASFMRAIELFKEGDITGGILATTIGVVLVGAVLKLNGTKIHNWFTQLLIDNKLATTQMQKLAVASNMVLIGITLLGAGIMSLSSVWDDLSGVEQFASVFSALTLAIISAAIALNIFKGNWAMALGVGAAVAGGTLLAATQLRDVTSLQSGATSNSVNVSGGMANLQNGIINAVRTANAQGSYGGGIDVYLDKDKVGFGVTKSVNRNMVRTGLLKVT